MSTLIFFILMGSVRSATTYVYVGAGGCDDDDPSCSEPEGTDLITTCVLGDDGGLRVANSTAGIAQPTWLLHHPTRSMLYATETGGSSIWSLRVHDRNSDDTDTVPSLEIVNHQDVGEAPVHLSFDVTGSFVFSANYMGGSLSALPIESDGSLGPACSTVSHVGDLGPNQVRQDAPHVHGTFTASAPGMNGTTLVYAMDLGQDRVSWYLFDPTTRALTNGSATNFVQTAPGSGPRHMVLTEGNQYGTAAHVITEMGSTIETWAVDALTGALIERKSTVSTLPASQVVTLEGNDTAAPHLFSSSPSPTPELLNKAAEIAVSSNGKFIYASNRGFAAGSNSLVVYSVDISTGALSPIQFIASDGTFPRGVALVTVQGMTKLLVGGQDTNSVATFAVDEATGLLTEEGALFGIVTPVAFAY